MKKENELILVRGASGSGKSTFSKKEFPDYNHYEADMYFYKNGIYTFDPSRLSLAHKWCQASTRVALEDGKNAIVSNTFIMLWEIQPYIDMANELNIPVTIYRSNNEYQNTHGCPDNIVARMKSRIEDIPNEILIKG